MTLEQLVRHAGNYYGDVALLGDNGKTFHAQITQGGIYWRGEGKTLRAALYSAMYAAKTVPPFESTCMRDEQRKELMYAVTAVMNGVNEWRQAFVNGTSEQLDAALTKKEDAVEELVAVVDRFIEEASRPPVLDPAQVDEYKRCIREAWDGNDEKWFSAEGLWGGGSDESQEWFDRGYEAGRYQTLLDSGIAHRVAKEVGVEHA